MAAKLPKDMNLDELIEKMMAITMDFSFRMCAVGNPKLSGISKEKEGIDMVTLKKQYHEAVKPYMRESRKYTKIEWEQIPNLVLSSL